MKKSRLIKDAIEIFNASLKAVDPIIAVKKHVSLQGDVLRVGDRDYNLSKYAHIYVVGCGKAAASMSYALEDILQNRIDGGIIVKYGHTRDLKLIFLINLFSDNFQRIRIIINVSRIDIEPTIIAI